MHTSGLKSELYSVSLSGYFPFAYVASWGAQDACASDFSTFKLVDIYYHVYDDVYTDTFLATPC